MTAVLVIACAAAAMTLALARSVRLEPTASRTSVPASNPVRRAEQILAARYANGSLSAQEYQRSLAVLRR